MKKLLLLCAILLPVIISAYRVAATTDKEEAKKGYALLNNIRSNPGAYSKEIGTNLNSIRKRPALKWNDTLARVAETKALDMAKRKYFAHVDPDGNGINIKMHKAGYKLPESWIKNKRENYFESISAGNPTCEDAIRALILDKGQIPPEHRNHLLGLNDFWESCTDIGIGFVTDPKSEYSTYTCVIIAKRK